MAKPRTPQFDVHGTAGPGYTDSGTWCEKADGCILVGGVEGAMSWLQCMQVTLHVYYGLMWKSFIQN